MKYERLMDQLSILEDASTDGMSVSYIHTHPAVDVKVNSKGYGSFGRADGGIPEFYTDRWWSLWNKFSGECAKRNIGLGLDDYVVGWAKMDIMWMKCWKCRIFVVIKDVYTVKVILLIQERV